MMFGKYLDNGVNEGRLKAPNTITAEERGDMVNDYVLMLGKKDVKELLKDYAKDDAGFLTGFRRTSNRKYRCEVGDLIEMNEK